MASINNYYINSSSFSTASAVFSNASLTILAPDSYYSDGIIVRQQISGVLMPSQGADSCTNANINYTINKNTTTACSSAIFNMKLKIDQNAPSYNVNYLNRTVTSNTVGYINIPTGMTKVSFSFTYNTSSCTRMQSYLVINGAMVATQQFPILVGGSTYTMSYNVSMTSNTTILAYVSNY